MSVGTGRGWSVDDIVDLAVNAAVDGVNEAVALAAAGMDEERCREDSLAAGREHDIDGVIHAAGHHRLDQRSLGPFAEDVRRPRHERRLAGSFVGLLGERSLAPIDPAVGPQVGTVEVVGAARERLALNHSSRLSAMPSPSVSVSFQMLGGGGDVERTVDTRASLRGTSSCRRTQSLCRRCRRRFRRSASG